jgi:hypothetical protein
VTKYQIAAINSCWEKCDEKYLGTDGRTDGRTVRGKTVYPTPLRRGYKYQLEKINSLRGLLVWKICKGKFEVVSFVIWFARKLIVCLFVCLMVFHATFNNIAVISWRSVLLVEETRGAGGKHRPVAIHWQTLSHNVVHLGLIEIWIHNVSDDRNWLHR